MEDYEVLNAQAWDDSIPPPVEPAEFAWTEVESKKTIKQKKKATQQPPKTIVQQRPALRSVPAQPLQHPLSGLIASRNQRFGSNQPSGGQTQQAARRRAPQKPSKTIIKPTRLASDGDNEAALSWRERKQPTDQVRIPTWMVLADHEAQHATGSATYERLAKDVGAFVYHDENSKSNNSLAFGIWGEPAAASSAKRAILEWVDAIAPDSKSAASVKFGKAVSLTPELRQRAEKRWKKDVKRSRYRRFPPLDMAFEAIGSFHWPTTDFSPEGALGMSCEALDPIRLQYECYIAFVKERSMFQVCGKAADVQAALLCIRKTVFQMAAKTVGPVRAYLLHWAESADVPTHVYLERHVNPKVITPARSEQADARYSPRAEGIQDDDRVIKHEMTNSALSLQRIRVTLGNALKKTHYQRGALHLRVRFGIFLLVQYHKPEDENQEEGEEAEEKKEDIWEEDVLYRLAEFQDMTVDSTFWGRVTEELGDTAKEALARSNIVNADDILSPQGALIEHLSEVVPSYRVSFVLADPKDQTKGDLLLSMELDEVCEEDSKQSHFIERSRKWTRLEPGKDAAIKLVDMSLTNLHTGSAWQFEITRADSIDAKQLPDQLRAFANSIRIDPHKALARQPGECFVRYNPIAKVKHLRQSVVYQYAINDSDYTLELACFQNFDFSDGPLRVYEPRWSVNVLRVEWDTMFAKNERLAIGASADWDDSLDTWFPKNWGSEEDGFALLMKKLGAVEGLVNRTSGYSETETARADTA